jgi:TetR/AcrR family transcriptional regulator, regulator of cefoperazone and chloramphenicol sensitivity
MKRLASVAAGPRAASRPPSSSAGRAKSDRETRERLLAAAKTLFADRGFKKVTVRDICRQASANVAAVNYHFGDKLGLYREVLQEVIDVMRATTEAARAAGTGENADERLRRYIATYLHRLLAPGDHDWIHRLIARELNDPTPALDQFVEQAVRPRIDYLSAVVAEMLHAAPSDQVVLRCVASIQAQSIAYLPNPIAARLGLAFKPSRANVDAVARHIADFSIAGVYATGRSRRGFNSRRARDRAASARSST